MKNKLTKLLAFVLAAGMVVGSAPVNPYAGTTEESTEVKYDGETSGDTDQETAIYGYLNLEYAEFYSPLVDSTADMDAVTVATVASTDEDGNAKIAFANAWVEFQDANDTSAGYKVVGVKNVPVKLKDCTSTENDTWLTERGFTPVAEGTTLSQYAVLEKDSDASKWKVAEWVFNQGEVNSTYTTELSTAGTWGEYQINVVETEGNLLRNTRSDVKDSSTGEKWAINSEIMGIVLTATDADGNTTVSAGTGHMANIWYQPYEVSFGVTVPDKESGRDEAYNNDGFAPLVGKTVTKITYIMPDTVYEYNLSGDNQVYVKEVFAGGLSAEWQDATLSDGTATKKLVFAGTDSFSGLTNPKISISYTSGSGRKKVTTYLMKDGETTTFELNKTEYTLTEAFPDGSDGLIPDIKITSDSHADFYVTYPMLAWQRTKLNEDVTTADTLIAKLDASQTATLKEHRDEAAALLENSSATAQEARDLLSELEELITAAEALLPADDGNTDNGNTDNGNNDNGNNNNGNTDNGNSNNGNTDNGNNNNGNTDNGNANNGNTDNTGSADNSGNNNGTTATLEKGVSFTSNNVTYKVTAKDTEVQYVKTTSTSAKVTIPETVTYDNITYKVTTLAASAFKKNTKITQVVIGNNVTAIPASAFNGCTKLKKVTIGTGVTKIGNKAFYGCKKLSSLTIGKNVTSIGNSAFANCVALTSVTVPNKVTAIGQAAFSGCTKLKKATLGTAVKTIGKQAFKGDSKLATITINSKKLTSVGKNAFKGIKSTAKIKVPSAKLKSYKTLLKNKGQGSKVTIVKK